VAPFTVTAEPAYQNVRLDYIAPAATERVTFSRTGPSGVAAVVRGYSQAPVGPGEVIARDYEAPIGVPLTYTVLAETAAGADLETLTATVTVPSQGCADTWLNDLARVGNTLAIVIEQLPELDYPVPVTTHDVITRRTPIVTSDVAHTAELELSFLTDSDDERMRARAMLGNGIPVLLRTPPEDGIGNMYLAVLGFREQRIVSSGTVPDRRFVVNARHVSRPDPTLFIPLAAVVYEDVRATYATYLELRTDRTSYESLLYDYTGDEPSDIVPWPPVDV
jgi:hypothetical protein